MIVSSENTKNRKRKKMFLVNEYTIYLCKYKKYEIYKRGRGRKIFWKQFTDGLPKYLSESTDPELQSSQCSISGVDPFSPLC